VFVLFDEVVVLCVECGGDFMVVVGGSFFGILMN